MTMINKKQMLKKKSTLLRVYDCSYMCNDLLDQIEARLLYTGGAVNAETTDRILKQTRKLNVIFTSLMAEALDLSGVD